MLQYYCFYCIFEQINILMSIFLSEASFKKCLNKITDPKPLNEIVLYNDPKLLGSWSLKQQPNMRQSAALVGRFSAMELMEKTKRSNRRPEIQKFSEILQKLKESLPRKAITDFTSQVSLSCVIAWIFNGQQKRWEVLSEIWISSLGLINIWLNKQLDRLMISWV